MLHKKISQFILFFAPFFYELHSYDKQLIHAHKLFERAQYAQAIPQYEQFIKESNDIQSIQTAQVNLAQCYIAHGLDTDDPSLWQRAWPLWQQRIPFEVAQGKRVALKKSLQFGQSVKDKVILVRTEYGCGDTFTFVRYLKLLKELGARKVILVVQPSQSYAFEQLTLCMFIDEVIMAHDPVPYFDHDVYLMSLPAMISTEGYVPTTPETIYHANEPYIFPDPALLKKWQQQIDPTKINIALCWQASKNPVAGGTRIIDRDIALSTLLETLASIDNVQIYSVQGPPHYFITTSQLKKIDPNRTKILDQKNIIPDALQDSIIYDYTNYSTFGDNLAVMALCDVFVGIDTSRPNIAAAMGKKTYFLLKKERCDMRWGTTGTITPWFSSARLLRQENEGDWQDVMIALKKEIEQMKIN